MDDNEVIPTTVAPLDRAAQKKIPVLEIFGPTFQGEGAMCGQQTYFMRFGLCDYDCKLCDSRHAVDPVQVKALARWETQREHFDWFIEVYNSNINPCNWITYSGGNPCIHNLTQLTKDLTSSGFKINVETQGTKAPEWLAHVDIITVSPKSPGMGEKFEPEVFEAFITKMAGWKKTVAVKVVIFSQRDLEFAALAFQIAKTQYPECSLYLSLGNPYPPQHHATDHLSKEAVIREIPFDDLLKITLLKDYRILCEDILKDARFSDVIFLPQLHVLTWANKAKV